MNADDQILPEIREWAFHLQGEVKKADIEAHDGTRLKIREDSVRVKLAGSDEWATLTPPAETSS